MILKQQDPRPPSDDKKLEAGKRAEQQMAFYLHRAFAEREDLLVINDLRLVDPRQPDPDGSPGAAQIDHLVLHRWGVFIVESKSVTDAVEVRSDGSGGDEWCRVYGRKRIGFASPLKQGARQGEFLRDLLRANSTALRQKKVFGIKQGTFRNMPVQVLVAISDNGRIDRKDKWQPRSKPLNDYIAKADLIPEKIEAEFSRHKRAASLFTKEDGAYGLWNLDPSDLHRVIDFLLQQHTPLNANPGTQLETQQEPRATRVPAPAAAPETRKPPSPPTSTAAETTCKHCGSVNLEARWGRYGYHWHCNDCDKNTRIPVICTACGAQGQAGKPVKVQKRGAEFNRICECGHTELVWLNQSC